MLFHIMLRSTNVFTEIIVKLNINLHELLILLDCQIGVFYMRHTKELLLWVDFKKSFEEICDKY